MFIVESFPIAVLFCIITMICWGSHANSLKLTPNYPFSFYYWDQVIGYFLITLVLGLTMGSFGDTGRNLIADLQQGSFNSFLIAILGGFVFNLANILFIASVRIAGMAVAFPIAIGIALVEGVIINYVAEPSGNAFLIFTGVAFITIAILVDAKAYSKLKDASNKTENNNTGIIYAIIGGILMGLFYYLVQRAISPNLTELEVGKFGPYAAVLVFTFGTLISNFVYNTYVMKHPFSGEQIVSNASYFTNWFKRNQTISILF